jgi:hypothetical protein
MSDILHPSQSEALAAWAAQVRENRQQAEKFREEPAGPDFYAPTSSSFKDDPFRTNDPVLDYLKTIARRDDCWLDIGTGGGRYALPLALQVRQVIAIDPSPSMLSILRQSMSEHRLNNIQVIQNRWPFADSPVADVAFMSHVGYDIEDIGPFLTAMEASSRRLCLAVLRDAAPSTAADRYWPLVHGEERVPLPGLREFILLQIARRRLCQVILTTGHASHQALSSDRILAFLRQQLFIKAGGAKERLLRQILESEKNGITANAGHAQKSSLIGIVSWEPGAASGY